VNELLYFVGSALMRLQSEPKSLVEIVIIAALIYALLSIIQGTTAMAILRGIMFVYIGGAVLGNVFGLSLVTWLLRNSLPALIVIVPILFAPELRSALEQLGRTRGVLRRATPTTATGRTIDVVARSANRLSELGWGALIVLERETGLGEYAETGTRIDASLSQDLLLNIFFPHAPLHDGAVMIRGDRIVAAGCLLPLSEAPATGGHLGTRHRAAIGISERTDALCVVVSEETGQISIANNGRMVRNLDEEKLRKVLQVIYRPPRKRPRWSPRAVLGRLVDRLSPRRSEAHPHA